MDDTPSDTTEDYVEELEAKIEELETDIEGHQSLLSWQSTVVDVASILRTADLLDNVTVSCGDDGAVKIEDLDCHERNKLPLGATHHFSYPVTLGQIVSAVAAKRLGSLCDLPRLVP